VTDVSSKKDSAFVEGVGQSTYFKLTLQAYREHTQI